MNHMALWIVILLIPMIPTFWAIIDVSKRDFNHASLQLIWLGLITFIPLFGAVGYFIWLKVRR